MQLLMSNHSLPTFFEKTILFEDNLSTAESIDESDVPCLERFSNDLTVTKPLSHADIDLIGRQYEIVNNYCKTYQKFSFDELLAQAHTIRIKAKSGPISEEERLKLIAIGRLAIRHHFDIYLYSTQILALLGVLIRGENKQAQIKTGEGKSLITTLWAFVMAMECRGVDIITSARYLAVRDQEKFEPFFKKCKITSSHICYDQQRPIHFRAQILYGPVFDFEFAWMRDKLWGTNLYAERVKDPWTLRNFDTVCVDEADNLLIDTAANGARIAYSAEYSYDWIYAYILEFAKANFQANSADCKEASLKLRDFICKNIGEGGQEIPSDEQLTLWLTSACSALFLIKENVNYIVKSHRNKTEGEKRRQVQIVDLQTGRISERSRWIHGKHECLEIKHGIEVQQESINPISLSHAVFYLQYQNIIALTGTAEHTQTADIYGLTTIHVPPHKPLMRKDLPTIYAERAEEYYEHILNDAQKHVQEERPLLILCETIQDSQLLEEQLQQSNIPCQLLNEVQEEKEETLIKRAGLPGIITIATNNAGRGTDIILDPKSLKNGGLHVLLAFCPETEREELQARGRAGRQGQPGSSQMIVNMESEKIKKLLNESNEKGIEIVLADRRRRVEQEQKAEHIQRANLERFLSEKANLFFDGFRTWTDKVKDDTFLDAQSL
ncbi:MAG: hypothetical protein JSR46_07755, partial [Verrucomicrobia bacterium]|nr:hypothetical protein [Verrucomicrobiota bacterium]